MTEQTDKAREIGFNTWFCSLPEGAQAVLGQDKWVLAHAAYDAAIESQRRTIEEKDAEIERLKSRVKELEDAIQEHENTHNCSSIYG